MQRSLNLCFKVNTKHFKENGASVTGEANEKDLKHEINMFLADYLQKRDCDPLKWWAINSNRFSRLSKFVRKYLCAPPSSVFLVKNVID